MASHACILSYNLAKGPTTYPRLSTALMEEKTNSSTRQLPTCTFITLYLYISYLPSLADKLLDILPENLRLLQRCKVAATLVPVVGN
jgi:hypothetical protein